MPLDWVVQQSRLSFFSREPISISEQDWKGITGQDEAENRTAVPNGKQYSGKFSGGLLSLGYSGARGDIVLNADENAEAFALEQKLTSLGSWDGVFRSFPAIVGAFLQQFNFPIQRLAFGAVLVCQSDSKEDAYEKLGTILSSVKVDPKNMRELVYRINWPQMSNVVPGLELNRITGWSTVGVAMATFQVASPQTLMETAGPTLHFVRLEIDHNTDQSRGDPVEPALRMPIFGELVEMARENATMGERP
jgi:hypothetical protein